MIFRLTPYSKFFSNIRHNHFPSNGESFRPVNNSSRTFFCASWFVCASLDNLSRMSCSPVRLMTEGAWSENLACMIEYSTEAKSVSPLPPPVSSLASGLRKFVSRALSRSFSPRTDARIFPKLFACNPYAGRSRSSLSNNMRIRGKRLSPCTNQYQYQITK